MNRLLILILLLSLPLFFQSCTKTQHEKVDSKTLEILDQVETLWGKVDAYTAEVTVASKGASGEHFESNGFIKFKKPHLVRQEMTTTSTDNPHKFTIIINGDVQWTYMPDLGVAERENIQEVREDALKRYGTIADFVDVESLRYMDTNQFEGEPVFVFEARPPELIQKKHAQHPARHHILVSTEDGILRKTVVYDEAGNEIGSQTFRTVRQDSTISENDFEFIPPEGVRVYDVTDAKPRSMVVSVEGAQNSKKKVPATAGGDRKRS